MNLFATLDQAASRFPDPGAVYHRDRRVCTWGELHDRALRLATSIRQQEGAGARAAIVSQNRPEIVELMFAMLRRQATTAENAVQSGSQIFIGTPQGAQAAHCATETPWFRWRLGLLDFDQGLVGPFRSVEDGFELCGR